MNRLARWMMRLYPVRWRKRYGDELDALIADTGADVRTVADLARGGIRMQFSTWSFPKLALVLGIAGVLLGTAASFLGKTVYESKVTLAVDGTTAQRDRLIEWAEPALLSRTQLSGVINNPQLLLYKDQLKTTPLDDVIELMQSNTHLSQGPGQTIDISFRYPDARKAQQTAASLADRLIAMSGNALSTHALEGNHPFLYVLDTATLPTSVPIEKAIGWAGFFLGASIPFVWHKIRRKKILSWWLLVAIPICAILGGISGDTIAILQNSNEIHLPGYRYRSTATMEIGGTTQEQIQDLIDVALTRTSLATIILDRRLLLYSDELGKTPLDSVVQEMKRRLTITPVPGHPNYVTVAFEYSDRFKAQQTVEAMMGRMDELWKQSGRGTAIVPLGDWGPVSIQSPPSPPQPIATNPYQYAGTGGLVGVILAALIALFRRRWTPEPDNSSSAITQ